jgi:putative aminopeptidase FrvX
MTSAKGFVRSNALSGNGVTVRGYLVAEAGAVVREAQIDGLGNLFPGQ